MGFIKWITTSKMFRNVNKDEHFNLKFVNKFNRKYIMKLQRVYGWLCTGDVTPGTPRWLMKWKKWMKQTDDRKIYIYCYKVDLTILNRLFRENKALEPELLIFILLILNYIMHSCKFSFKSVRTQIHKLGPT